MATAGEHLGRSRKRTRVRYASAIRLVEFAVGIVVFLGLLQAILQFNLFDPRLWIEVGYLGAFLRGIRGTMTYLALIVPLSLAIGFVLGWARVSRRKTFRWPVSIYVDFFRGVPPLVIVIFAFLFGPALLPGRLGIRDAGLIAAAVALGLHSAAYQAEIFRAGFQSVPLGQLEASQALGMRPTQSMQFVVLPQALRLSLPPLGNELALVIKDSSLLAIVGALDLFGISQEFAQVILFTPGSRLVWFFAVWTAVAIVYFAMTFTVTRGLAHLERKYHVAGLETVSV